MKKILFYVFVSISFVIGLDAKVLVQSDFTDSSTLAEQGWNASYKDGNGNPVSNSNASWSIQTYPGLSSPAAVFRNVGNSAPKPYAYLTTDFALMDFSDSILSLTFDYGWRYGGANYSNSAFQVALLDDQGNGYIFNINRTVGTNAVAWRSVTNGDLVNGTFNFGDVSISNIQNSIGGGGALDTLTITRSANGSWEISGAGWNGELNFSDSSISGFSSLVFLQRAGADQDISLTIDNVTLASVPETSTAALMFGGLVFACVILSRRR